MNILIIRYSSMGDVVMTSASIRCLRQQMPDAQITMVTHRPYTQLLPDQYLDKIIEIVDRDYDAAKTKIKSISWNYILDFQNTIRSRIFCVGLRGQILRTPKYPLRYWLFLRLGWRVLPLRPIAMRHIDVLHSLFVEYDGQGLELSSIHSAISRGRKIAIILGGQHTSKRLPPSIVNSVSKRYSDYEILLLGGLDIVQHVSDPLPPNCTNLVGQTINSSIIALASCSVAVSGDTGFMHIAAALSVSTVVIWRGTSPVLGFSPLYPDQCDHGAKHVFHQDYDVRKLSKYGRSPKGEKHMGDLDDNSTKALLSAIEAHLSPN